MTAHEASLKVKLSKQNIGIDHLCLNLLQLSTEGPHLSLKLLSVSQLW